MTRALWCLCWFTLSAVPLAAQRIKLPASVSELESRARKDSNDAAAHYNLALGYWSSNRFDDAERELRLAASIEPDFASPYLALAFLPFARRPSLWDDDAAEKHLPDSTKKILEESDHMFRRAFLIDPLVDLRIIGAVTPSRSVFLELSEEYKGFYDYYVRAFDDIDQGNYDRARDRFQSLIKDVNGQSHPDYVPSIVWYWHGLAAAHVQRYDDAIADFTILLGRAQKAERRDSLVRIPLRTNEYRYILADMNRRAGKLEAAVPLYREALENDLGLYEAHVRLAEIAEANNAVDAAIAERRAAVNANPDDSGLLLDLGVTLGKAGEFNEAEQALKQAIATNPRDTRSYYYLGIIQQKLGKGGEARDALTTFIAMAPSRFTQQIQSARQFVAQR
jgi:tetratricopeptide (TPR) repeat protein